MISVIDREAGRVAGLCQQLEALDAEALERVGRGPGLESAAAQHACAGFLYVGGDRDELLPALDRARARHDDDLRPAEGDAADLDQRGGLAELVRDQLVRLEDRRDRLDPGDRRERLFPDDVLRADDPDDDADGAAGDLGTEAPLLDAVDDVLDLRLGRAGLGDDHHGAEKGRVT